MTGSLTNTGIPRKVRHYADDGNERCVVRLFHSYMSFIPANGRFYRRPLIRANGAIAFSEQPIGINKLATYIPSMFQKAGISTEGRTITGHSGKVTCCTRLYEAGFNEQEIMHRSGHRSSAVRLYKRPSEELQQRVSDHLQPPRPSSAPLPCTVTSAASCAQNSPKKHTESDNFPCKLETDDSPTDDGILTISVPSNVTKVVIMKGSKKITLEI